MIIAALLAIRVGINIVFEDELKVYLKVLFLKFRLFPAKEKRFDEKKHDKKKKKKANAPAHVIKKKKADAPEKPSLLDNIKMITEILSVLFKAFAKHLHVKLAKIHIRVGTPDAAQTAITYGAISAAVACLVDIIDEITHLGRLKKSSILVEPDFLSERCEAKINISLSTTVFDVLSTLLKTLFKYITLKYKKM